MRSDEDIQRDVEQELKWHPNVDASDIAVSVRDGVVELAGFVRTYTERFEAEDIAKRVKGVLGLANDLVVRLPVIDERPDPDIAHDAVSALRTHTRLPDEAIKVIVNNGWIALEGEVEWHYQREAAEKAVRKIRGVKGVTNLIQVIPRAQPVDIKEKIRESLSRLAELDAQCIQVEVKDGQVILKGTVRSWAEREEAVRAAWAAPGVSQVDNQIVVSPAM